MTPAQITKKGGLTVTKMVSLTNTPRRTIYDLFERDQPKFIDLAVKARTDLYKQELACMNDEYNQDIINLEGDGE